MNAKKRGPALKRVYWRITETAPMGEWFDPNIPRPPDAATALPEVSTGGWIPSSFDLLSGADVIDNPDTVPNALWDELIDSANSPRRFPKG